MEQLLRILVLMGLFAYSSTVTSEVWPPDALAKGYIQNDQGQKCWYKQKAKMNNTYFHKGMTGNNGVLTFDNPTCMSDSGAGLEVNMMLINNVITRGYSHADADFQTKVSQLYPSSMSQIKGKCIQSKKYPIIGVVVDYFIKGDSITGVIHGSSLMGCKES